MITNKPEEEHDTVETVWPHWQRAKMGLAICFIIHACLGRDRGEEESQFNKDNNH